MIADDRFFGVIVLGGLSLVGGSGCGANASSGAPDGADAAAEAPTELEDARAREEVPSEQPPFVDGGPFDLHIAGRDATATVDASPLRDAELAADMGVESSDADGSNQCTFASFPSETAISICTGRCNPAGCPCVIPTRCACDNCVDAGAANSGG